MPMNLKGRSLDSALNFTTDQINYLIDLAIDLKKSKLQGLHVNNRPLVGKNIAIMFQKVIYRLRILLLRCTYHFRYPLGLHIRAQLLQWRSLCHYA